MKEVCRICARDLCGTQRRWLFHASSRLNLQVVLSHAVGLELSRDGRPEFCCSKCAFMLERVYRFDTVVARVEALSLERIHRLLQEKEALRQCVGRLYRRNNRDPPAPGPGPPEGSPQDARYSELIRDDLAFSEYESWAEKEEEEEAILDLPLHTHHCQEAGPKARRCKGCAALRVPDSDYEAVCRVPRRLGRRSTSCGPNTRYSESLGDDGAKSPDLSEEEEEPDDTEEEESGAGGAPERATPGQSTCPGHEPEPGAPKAPEVQADKRHKGSKLPILMKTRAEQQEVRSYPQEVRSYPQEVRSYPQEVMWEEFEEMEEEWNDEYVQCGPFRFQQRVMEQQSQQLSHCETTTDLCLTELKTAQTQVQTLQAKIRISEDRNKLLQKRLGEMEVELRAVREEAQTQDRTLQNLTDSLCSKEHEVQDLSRVVEEQNRALCSLKELSHKQVSTGEAAAVQSELVSLQLALFQSQLQLESEVRTHKNRDRTERDLRVALERTEADLQGALQRGRDSLQHNQELQLALDQTRSSLRDSEEQQNQTLRQNQDQSRVLSDLRERLRKKEQMVQDYRDLLDSREDQDSEVQKLRQVLKDREQELETLFQDQDQSQQRELQELLRDKQNDLQTQRQVLQQNQETIRSLEVLVRGQSLQMEQLRASLGQSGLKEDRVQTELNRTLSEKDSVIRGLQEVLQERDQEVQDLCLVLSQNPLCPHNVLQQLKLRLQLKDRLLQEVMSDRTRQTRDQAEQVQQLVRTIDQRDQYIQDSSPRFLELLKEQSDRIKELRTQLSSELKPDQSQDQDQDLDWAQRENQDQVWTLKDQLRKNQENQDQVQRDLEEKNRLIKELVLELQELRGRLRVESAPDRGLLLGLEREEEAPESGDVSEEDEDSEDDSDLGPVKSESFSDPGLLTSDPGLLTSDPGLKLLLEQKRAVDRELSDLKTQLQKTGFKSLSQTRKALMDLRTENQDLRTENQDLRAENQDLRTENQDLRQEGVEPQQQQQEEGDQWEGWDPAALTFDPDEAEKKKPALAQDSPLHRGAVDLGYETCERSETEAERDTSSPEFDDLEMCLSLDHGSHWWNLNQDQDQDQNHTPTHSPDHSARHRPGERLKLEELQRLVQNLRSELNRSQSHIQRLQTSLRSKSSESHLDPDFTDLLSRVQSLENQLKTETKTDEVQDGKKTGYLSLVHLQARELSHLRQVLRESRGLAQILVQSLAETVKGFESLLPSSEVDYSLGQTLREQLQENQELLERICSKISLKELPEEPDDKTELLAMRLSKELQQKDRVIESLRSRLRSDTPTSSTDQSDRISYVSDEQLSNQDEEELDLGSETASELQQLDQSQHSVRTSDQSERFNHTDSQSASLHSSVPPSVASVHSFPSMPCSGSLFSPGDAHSAPLLSSLKTSSSLPPPPSGSAALPPHVPGPGPGPGPAPGSGAGFSLAEVHQELQMLQRQLQGHSHSVPSSRPALPSHLRPIVAMSLPGFSSSSLDSGLRPGLPLSTGALWDTSYTNRPITEHLSPAASSYTSLTGSDLLSEHLCEVRSLKHRLEESIQTNERLRHHLETRLDTPPQTAPTNIYIQGVESSEIRVLRETNSSLQTKLRESVSEAERLRETLLLVQTRLKEAELQAQRWAELSRSSQSEAAAQRQEVTELRHEKQCSLELVNRLHQEVSDLQQQLRESQALVQSLQRRHRNGQSEQRGGARSQSEQRGGARSQSDNSSVTLDLPGLRAEEKRARRQLQFRDGSSVPDPGPGPDQDQTDPEDSGSSPHLVLVWTQDFLRLQQNLQDSLDLLRIMDQSLKTRPLTPAQPLTQDCERLRALLQEAHTLSLRTRPGQDHRDHRDQSLEEELSSLRQKLSERDRTLKETLENLQQKNESEEKLERLIVSQLSRTRDVLRKAKTNLQVTRSDALLS